MIIEEIICHYKSLYINNQWKHSHDSKVLYKENLHLCHSLHTYSSPDPHHGNAIEDYSCAAGCCNGNRMLENNSREADACHCIYPLPLGY
jgi:iron only hydrogenase large subunit-like protein